MTVSGNALSMVRGDTEAIKVSVTEDGSARPLVEGDTVYFTVKRTLNTTEKSLQKTITSFTDGAAVINISASDTSSLAFGDYLYDIQINLADGTVKTVVQSTLTLLPEVTYE